MKRIVSYALCLVFLLAVAGGSAFALDTDELRSPLSYYEQMKGKDVTINVYNWGEYISDGSDDMLDVVSEFEELTGIKVNYTTFASNEEMYAKIKSGGAQYDVIVPSEYMISRMMNEDMLLPLDFSNIPNFKLVDDAYKYMEYDPESLYSVPYMWGMVGLIYDSTQMEEVTSWDVLWDERYLGDILMFSNSRDAFGISLMRLGYSINTESFEELDEAAEELRNQKMLVQAYVMDEIFNKMEGSEAVVAPYYAGDALTMMDENPDLAFAYPEEGTNIFVDAFVIPKGSTQKAAAEMFINFMSEPLISAENANYIGYFTTVEDAWDYMDFEYFEPVYPSDEVIEKSQAYKALSSEANVYVDRLWTEMLSYDQGGNEWFGPVFLVGALVASVAINVMRAHRKKKEKF